MKQSTKMFRIAFYSMIILSFSLLESYGHTDTTFSETNLCQKTVSTMSLGNFIVTEHITDIDIISVDNITVNETITILNNQSSTDFLYIFLNQPYENNSLTITDIEGYQLPFEFVNDTNLINISLLSQLNSSDDIKIELSYKLQIELPDVPGKPTYYILQFEQFFTYLTYQHSTQLRLPIECYIHEEKNVPIPVTPENYTDTVSGKRLYILWDHENLQSETTLGFTVFFDEPITPSHYIWAYFVGPALGMILGGAIVVQILIWS